MHLKAQAALIIQVGGVFPTNHTVPTNKPSLSNFDKVKLGGPTPLSTTRLHLIMPMRKKKERHGAQFPPLKRNAIVRLCYIGRFKANPVSERKVLSAQYKFSCLFFKQAEFMLTIRSQTFSFKLS